MFLKDGCNVCLIVDRSRRCSGERRARNQANDQQSPYLLAGQCGRHFGRQDVHRVSRKPDLEKAIRGTAGSLDNPVRSILPVRFTLRQYYSWKLL